jgi:glycosyltransferase involved in cell wall biosynthesis
MWKARPVLASRVGSIQEQITDDRNGLLLDDPSDLAAFGRATATLLEEHERAARLGREAHRSVRHHYLAARRLTQELDLINGSPAEQPGCTPPVRGPSGWSVMPRGRDDRVILATHRRHRR